MIRRALVRSSSLARSLIRSTQLPSRIYIQKRTFVAYESLENHMQKKKDQLKLVTKHPKDSLVTLYLPFSTNEKLREVYVNQQGGTRIGRLLEDLDSLAAEGLAPKLILSDSV
jgi:hypothetical protein